MRAVVLAVKENKAAVAFKGGELRYIADRGYVRGQILDIPLTNEAPLKVIKGKKSSAGVFSRYASSVAAAASILILTGAVTAYALPVSTVTVDINPSLSMGINIFDRVVSADYQNEDGKELLTDISGDLRGKRLSEAMEIVFDEMAERDYIDGKDVLAESTIAGFAPKRRHDRMMEELYSSAEKWNKAHDDRSVSFEAKPLDDDLKKEALDKGMTPGQVLLERRAPKPFEEGSIPGTDNEDNTFSSPDEMIPENGGSGNRANDGDHGSGPDDRADDGDHAMGSGDRPYNGDPGNTDQTRDDQKSKPSRDDNRVSDPKNSDDALEKPEDAKGSREDENTGNSAPSKDNGNPSFGEGLPKQDNNVISPGDSSVIPRQDNGNAAPDHDSPKQDNKSSLPAQDSGYQAPEGQPPVQVPGYNQMPQDSGYQAPEVQQPTQDSGVAVPPQDNNGFIPSQENTAPPAADPPPENSGSGEDNGGGGGDPGDGGNDESRDGSHGDDRSRGEGSRGGDPGGSGGSRGRDRG